MFLHACLGQHGHYTGKPYSNFESEKILKKFGLTYSKKKDKEIARLISENKIIARCSGGSEYGPRALGNRSILADPRKNTMRDYLNKEVKNREFFRPFAPLILEEKCCLIECIFNRFFMVK